MILTFTITGADLVAGANFKTFNPHKDIKFRKLTLKRMEHNIYGTGLIKSISSGTSGIEISRHVRSQLFLDLGGFCDNDEVQDIGESDTGLIPMGYALEKPSTNYEGERQFYQDIACDYAVIDKPTHWTTSTDLKFEFKYYDIEQDATPSILNLNNDADADAHITYDAFTMIRLVFEAELIDSH